MELPIGCTLLVSSLLLLIVSKLDNFFILFFCGFLLILTSFIAAMNAWAKMYKKCAERDGKISCGEKFGMAVNSFSTGAMSIVEFAMMIWGSVVVFGAWSTWTDDYDEYIADVDNKNYCAYT